MTSILRRSPVRWRPALHYTRPVPTCTTSSATATSGCGRIGLLPNQPLGMVPTLRTDDGEVLTENAAILHTSPNASAGQTGAGWRMQRPRLHQWLCFIRHRAAQGGVPAAVASQATADAKAYAAGLAEAAACHCRQTPHRREFLLDRFSVADPYLFTVLNWSARQDRSAPCRRSRATCSGCRRGQASPGHSRKSLRSTKPRLRASKPPEALASARGRRGERQRVEQRSGRKAQRPQW